jgi:hypothetical protein
MIITPVPQPPSRIDVLGDLLGSWLKGWLVIVFLTLNTNSFRRNQIVQRICQTSTRFARAARIARSGGDLRCKHTTLTLPMGT